MKSLLRFSAWLSIWLCMGLCFSTEVQATHIVGGDLTFVCLNPATNTYRFTLRLYRDCSGISIGNASLSFTSTAGCGTVTAPSRAANSISNVSQLCDPNTATCANGSNQGTEEWLYTWDLVLPRGCDSWVASYSTCCRSGAITNITAPGSANNYIETRINTNYPGPNDCNSSPQFTSQPVLYTCAGQQTFYNHGGIDPDGDSLVYTLIPPRNTATTNSTFVTGLSATTPLRLQAATTFQMDPNTGQMVFTPIAGQGQIAVIGVEVREFRNGVLISQTYRELQVVVLNNCANQPPSPATINVTGATRNGNVIEVCGGNTLSFVFTVPDNNAADSVFITSNIGLIIPGATLTTTGRNPVIGTFTVPTAGLASGVYPFSVTIRDNACPIPSVRIETFSIDINNLQISADRIFICPNEPETIQLTALGFGGAAAPGTYSWSPAALMNNPNIHNPVATTVGTVTFYCTYTDANCQEVDSIDITAPFPAILNPIPDVVICNGTTAQLGASVQAGSGGQLVTFNTPTNIPANTTTNITIPVANVIPTTLQASSLQSVCLTLTQNLVAHLNISLVAPTGEVLQLTQGHGTFGSTSLTNVCFTQSATTSINNFQAPFPSVQIPPNTAYQPFGAWGSLTGATANGNWTLRIQHTVAPGSGGVAGSFSSIQLTFADLSAATFTWGPNFNISCMACDSPVVSPPVDTFYQVVAQNLFGCRDTGIARVFIDTAFPVPTITCDSSGIGVVRFRWNPVAGAAGYRISVDGGASFDVLPGVLTHTVNGLALGQCVDIEVISLSGTTCANSAPGALTCCAADCSTIDPLNITPSGPTTFCAGSSVTLDAGPGASFEWSSGQTTRTIDVTTSGLFIATVTDVVGCRDTGRIEVVVNSLPNVSITPSGATILCAGETVDLDAGVYNTYIWSTGETTQVITASVSGNYEVTVGSVGCPGIASISVTVGSPLQLSMSSVPQSCNGAVPGNGQAEVAASGSFAPYTYTWSNGGNTALLTALGAGGYDVTVTDDNACTATGSVTVTEPSALTVTAAVTSNYNGAQISCFGVADGSAELTALGGTGSTTYEWDNGQTNAIATGLAAGQVCGTVTDANGCAASACLTLTQPTAVTASIASSVSVSCFGGNDGEATAQAAGGTGAYNFIWCTGATAATNTGFTAGTCCVTVTDANGCVDDACVTTTQPSAVTATIVGSTPTLCNGSSDGTATVQGSGGQGVFTYLWDNGQTTPQATGLPAGQACATVTDGNGCSTTACVTITEPSAVSVTAAVISNFNGEDVSCFNATDGRAEATANGGNGPYIFVWSNAQTATIAQNLGAGSYDVIATDANGCTASASVSLTEPSAVSVTASSTAVSCFAGNDGTVTGSASGGVGNYTYNWAALAQNTATATGAAAGVYTVVATDDNGCSASANTTVTQPAAPLTISMTNTAVLCFGGSTGTATATPAGGTSPYSFAWPNSETTATSTGYPAGTVVVTVTDANACTATASTTIGAGTPLAQTMTATDVLCNGGNTGTASVNASGGVGGFTYAWDRSPQTTATVTGLAVGTHCVTVTDANGCTISNCITLAEPAALGNHAFTVSNILCAGQSNGSASISLTGGIQPYTYAWSNGGNTQGITSVPAGSYGVTVTDANLCTYTASVNVTEPLPLQLSLQADSARCRGGNDGQVIATVSGGVGPYSYLWSNGHNSANNLNLTGGTYAVTVTDFNGCRLSASEVVGEPQVAVTANIVNILNATCNGANDGEATAVGAGGTAGYTFQWSDGQVTPTATNLVAGTYRVTVTDVRGCSASAQTTIGQPSAIVANAQVFSNFNGAAISCPGASDGSARVLVSGGQAPYTYLWSGVSPQNGFVATNLVAGTYQVTVTDAAGCQVVRSVTLNDPTPLQATFTQQNIFCHGQSTGQILVNATPGTGTIGVNGYEYAIFGPGQTGGVYSGVNSFFNLPAGTFTVIVRDGNNCELPLSITLIEPPVLSATTSSTQVSCRNGNDGTATVNATGGTPNYTYRWSNGAQTQSITGLVAGGYIVTVTDANGCDVVRNVTITQPSALSATVASQPASCNGASNGGATVTANGGTPGYLYAWSNGQNTISATNYNAGVHRVTVSDANNCQVAVQFTVTQPSVLAATATATAASCSGTATGQATASATGGTAPYNFLWNNGQTTATATGLAAGSYTVMITDANGCTSNALVTINQPNPITATITASQNISCFGGNNGSATVAGSGGTAPFSFLWSNGRTTATANNLVAGVYTVTVSDAQGCQAQATVNLIQPTLLVIDSFVRSQVSCRGGSNGAATVRVSGGTMPYSYQWTVAGQSTATLSNRPAGLYGVTVTDANGCRVNGQVLIEEPAQNLVATLNATAALCNGAENGQIVAVVGGGTPNAAGEYNYLWSNGSTSSILSAVAAGNYSVTITDANGCSIVRSGTVGQGGTINLAIVNRVDVTCFGGNNGSATAQASGGASPLSYRWSDGAGQTLPTATNLSAGTYYVTVSDANGCERLDSVTINEPAQITVNPIVRFVSCFGGSDGSITLNSPSVSLSLYEWSTGDVGATLNSLGNLPVGSYGVTVTSNLGCSQAFSYSIEEPALFEVSLAQTAAVSCHAGTDARLAATVVGGTPNFSYLWSTGTSGTQAQLLNLGAGVYRVTAVDGNGCQASDELTVLEPEALAINVEPVGAICAGQANGRLVMAAEGGTIPNGLYEYSVDSVSWQTGNIFPSLPAGIYTAYVRDNNGCVVSVATSVDDADPFFIVSASADTTVIYGDSLELFVTLNDNSSVTALSWTLLGNGNQVLDSANYSLGIAPMVGGIYQFQATNGPGCQVDTTIRIEVEKPRTANAPNAFTPNGDGTNDRFFLQGDEDKVRNIRLMRVYDRWGELVYEGVDLEVNNPNQGWDGSFRGKPMNSGSFAWYAEVEFIDGEVKVLRGDITLLR